VLLRSRTSLSDADEIAPRTVVSWAHIGHLQSRAKLCFRRSFFDPRDNSSLHWWGWRRISRWRRTCAQQQGDKRAEQSSGPYFDDGDFFGTIRHRDQSTKTTDSKPGGIEARLPRRKSVPFWRDRSRGLTNGNLSLRAGPYSKLTLAARLGNRRELAKGVHCSGSVSR
jgi:hypothetical protein